MKLTKVIILIFLLVKSTIGFGGIASLVNSDYSCCSDKTEFAECESDSEDKEEKKGCCGDQCECTCCSTVLITLYTIDHKPDFMDPMNSIELVFTSIYQHQFKTGVWQPPKLA